MIDGTANHMMNPAKKENHAKCCGIDAKVSVLCCCKSCMKARQLNFQRETRRGRRGAATRRACAMLEKNLETSWRHKGVALVQAHAHQSQYSPEECRLQPRAESSARRLHRGKYKRERAKDTYEGHHVRPCAGEQLDRGELATDVSLLVPVLLSPCPGERALNDPSL
jgi:hypothetical protein